MCRLSAVGELLLLFARHSSKLHLSVHIRSLPTDQPSYPAFAHLPGLTYSKGRLGTETSGVYKLTKSLQTSLPG